ncbi:MAG: FkbM family methyltransferase [Robiginitomaculum sp.]|nr:FkbM family methyltransferase [Robiginitomaculum sp.]
MELQEFLNRREAERSWCYANGFGNGDPNTNGEYLCFDYFLKTGVSLALDVGANRGIFSARALQSQPDLHLLAFEPNPQVLSQLQENIAVGTRACIHQMALHDAGDAELSFYVHPVHHETSSLSRRRLMTSQFQADMHEISVPVRKLSAVLAETGCDYSNVFLKIDTEGHEAAVMRGAEQMLDKSVCVAILFEYSFAWAEANERIEDTFQFLNGLGYDFYRVLPVGLEHLRFITRDMAQVQYCNYLAIKGHAMSDATRLQVPSPYGANQLVLL